MTAISLVDVSRPGKTVDTVAIKVGQFSRGGNRLKGSTQLCEPPRFGTPGPQEFAGGFVDFLLGRTSRDPR
jgi:hypothetical protein